MSNKINKGHFLQVLHAIIPVYLFKVNTITSKQHSEALWFQLVVLLSIDKIKRIKIGDLMARFD